MPKFGRDNHPALVVEGVLELAFQHPHGSPLIGTIFYCAPQNPSRPRKFRSFSLRPSSVRCVFSIAVGQIRTSRGLRLCASLHVDQSTRWSVAPAKKAEGVVET